LLRAIDRDPHTVGVPSAKREMTYTRQRATFAVLLEDIRVHFQTLGQHPDLVLQQIGSPFATQE
jgi:hypothetical protein